MWGAVGSFERVRLVFQGLTCFVFPIVRPIVHAFSGNLAKWKPPEILQLRSQSRWKMPLQVRAMILARDSETCWYCGAPGDTVDHWIPLCRGGTNKTVNLVCACSKCNELKGNSMPDEFLAMRKMRGSTAAPPFMRFQVMSRKIGTGGWDGSAGRLPLGLARSGHTEKH